MESHLQGATQAVWVQLQISYETDFCTAATHLAGGGGGGGGGDCSEAIGMCVVAFGCAWCIPLYFNMGLSERDVAHFDQEEEAAEEVRKGAQKVQGHLQRVLSS